MATAPKGHHVMPDGSLMRDDAMGPPGESTYDTRMSALQSWKERPEPPAANESLVKALLPLVLAQAVDMMTTENALSQPSPAGWQSPREINPIPGMQSTGGRLGLQALESALVAALLSKKPKLGSAVSNGLSVMHSAAALGNQRGVEENQMMMRAFGGK